MLNSIIFFNILITSLQIAKNNLNPVIRQNTRFGNVFLLDAKDFNIRNLKVAYRLIFYGLDSCITCAILYPLINLASKNNLISVVEPNIFSKKEKYKNYILKLLNNYTDEYDSTVPVPVLLIQLTPSDELKLVSPGVITEIAMTLSDKLDSFEKLSFIDGETEINYFFVNMLQKLSNNLLDKMET